MNKRFYKPFKSLKVQFKNIYYFNCFRQSFNRLQNIQQNMESALEYMPEAFGNVVMLYIDCQVNGHHVKAFVDSGQFKKKLKSDSHDLDGFKKRNFIIRHDSKVLTWWERI